MHNNVCAKFSKLCIIEGYNLVLMRFPPLLAQLPAALNTDVGQRPAKGKKCILVHTELKQDSNKYNNYEFKNTLTLEPTTLFIQV